MENLMILPAVEPKRISWLNEYATDAEVITDIPQREKRHFRLSKQTQRLSNCRTSKTSALFLCSARTMN